MKTLNISFRKVLQAGYLTLALLFLALGSCEDFVDVDLPKDQITGEIVFQDPATVEAALGRIYSQLRENAFSTGRSSGITYLMGHYADELTLNAIDLPNVQVYANNNVLPSDNTVKGYWDTGYSMIYEANRIMEGVDASTELSMEEKSQFMGEAKFLRAYAHFYLMHLFGPVPYITGTDYRVNSEIARLEVEQVYQKLIEDLTSAKESLPTLSGNPEKARANHWAASALLARVFLYQGDSESALAEAEYVINQSGYFLETDLDNVFLIGSTETLWHLDTELEGTNTYEGFTFRVDIPNPDTVLSETLINSFEAGDARFSSWINGVEDAGTTWYFPFKYKQASNTEQTLERSVMLRLAEIYLIAAEAATQTGNTTQGLMYLNAIRERADLAPLGASDANILLEAIWEERQHELFTELGHRFFDLKRTERATQVLQPIKPDWQATDVLLPLPESELLANPELKPQNDGY
ncbi:RagB/SusD family nutrient uptake outer membrane protein [Flagellimonas aurea]|uniref:RagB/SusD family nutrient uptake outer membrane protein n=1 Tax=Flagellimonas aurea TaxID=2915619 RepID=A0ABS3G927_9FLAO|nr:MULTISPECIES: RagB/SusD family nutrient uptake outer membrane protein [Allomuricauda]MBO0355921.1 RagB/SusD family nutrient uptake outer membrane protein [Allomuricauda aurea]UBZ14578.1 RagB/SusD family nutrient uptake outer membrane protein [Allomuricauda aquimarina]